MTCRIVALNRAMDLRRVKSAAVVLFLFILKMDENVHSEIVQVPTDRTAVVNESTYFNCSTSKQPITDRTIKWFHYPLDGGGQRSDVYDDGRIRSHYMNRFAIERNLSSGQFNLIVLRLKAKDAGRYECSDDIHGDKGASAELTVLESNVMCASNMDPSGVIGHTQCKVPIAPDEVQMSCSVSSNGRNKPQMVWSESGDSSTSYKTNCVTKDNRVTCNTTLTASLQMSRSIYICKMTTHQYNCNLEIKNISYVFSGHTIILSEIGAEVNCSANSSQSCRYNWIWFNETHSETVSTNQTLKSKEVGSHRCEANCDVRNKSCEMDVMFVEVHSPKPVQATTGQSIYFWVSTSVLVIFIIGIISLAIFLVYYLRRNEVVIVVKTKADVESQTVEQAEVKIVSIITDYLHGKTAQIREKLQVSVRFLIENCLSVLWIDNSIAFQFQPNNVKQLRRLLYLLESKELQRHIELIYNDFLSKTSTPMKVHLTWYYADINTTASKLQGTSSQTYRTDSETTAGESAMLIPIPTKETVEEVIAKAYNEEALLTSGYNRLIYGPGEYLDKQCACEKIDCSTQQRTRAKEGKPTKEHIIRSRSQQWMDLDHDNLIKFFNVVSHPPGVFIIKQFAAGGSLRRALDKIRRTAMDLPIKVVLDWTNQIAIGINYLHDRGIVHRRLTSARVLLMEPFDLTTTSKAILKVTNFSLTHDDISNSDEDRGWKVIPWMAPEIRSSYKEHSIYSDTWSYGVIVWEILTGRNPYEIRKVEKKIMRRELAEEMLHSIPQSRPRVLRDIIQECIRDDPTERPTFRRILDLLRKLD